MLMSSTTLESPELRKLAQIAMLKLVERSTDVELLLQARAGGLGKGEREGRR